MFRRYIFVLYIVDSNISLLHGTLGQIQNSEGMLIRPSLYIPHSVTPVASGCYTKYDGSDRSVMSCSKYRHSTPYSSLSILLLLINIC